MRKEKTGKERFNELRYQMEKNSFVLNVLESRTAAVLHAESMGYNDTETAMISRISTEYVKLIRAVKNQHPGSIEDIAQELYDRIYMQTGWKRDYSRFQLFDEELIERWFIVKEQERQLRAGNIDLDDFIATAKHAYWSKTGKDVDVIVREIEEKPEQLEQQEEAPETEPDDEDDSKEMLKALNKRVAQDEIVCRMFREGAISEETALKYTGGDLEHESFMKLVKIYSEEDNEEKEPEETPEQAQARVDMAEAMRGWVADERREERLEALFELVQDGTLSAGNAFEYVPSDYGLDFDGFLRMQEAWEEERTDG